MPRRFLRGHNRRLIGSKGWLEGAYRYISVNGAKIAEHRHVVEQREGRKLTSKEIVHHIDALEKLNNDPDNLVVLDGRRNTRAYMRVGQGHRDTKKRRRERGCYT